MELFQLEHFMGLRGILLALWLILFVLSILLIISGTQIERKAVKMILVIFGVILALISIYLFMYTLLFGFNSQLDEICQ